MSKSHSTQRVTSFDRSPSADIIPLRGVARRGNMSRTLAVATLSTIAALGGYGFLQRSQIAGGDPEYSTSPAPAHADMSQVYGPTLEELRAEPVGCTITLETGDTAASVASELLGGESAYGHAILRHISQQGAGEGSAEGMLMAGQTVEIPVSHCGTVVDQTPTE